ncbi:FecR domain-containing protein [Methylocystis sp. L43]|uniref:FecR family protein n=1 Tax=unclassified Methylocystis TaxID=2625913 RepID=UPI0018C27D23|nr:MULTISPECIES: FecR family protein [unclassified Methylocystis]MBG0797699.1 FecR domain-containing protein [Methylocystis sp. L43]MBG0805305.1 FecR domain-containing protein [Methylocystis sp. H15]
MKKFSAAATTALALVAGPALADNVGNVGAVNQSAHGTPPGAAKRSLSVGLGVQRRERIETSPYGSAQIVFNDTSTMTVGRNSAVTVDDFVYSQGGGGQQGVSMAKGVMRFVGGGVSHEGGTRLRTPTASIGVRGGTALVRVGGSCGTLVVHQYGFIDVGGQALTRSGYGVCAPNGGPVSEPFLVPPETIAEIVAALESGKTQRGGAKRAPTNEEANLALGNDRPPDVVSPPGLDALGPVWFGNALVQSRANVDNQPAPLPTPARQGNGGHHDDHDHGGHGGHDHGGHEGGEGGHGGHGEGGHGGHGEGGHGEGGHGEGGHGGHGEGGHGEGGHGGHGEGGHGGGYEGGEGGYGGGYEGGEGGQYSGGGSEGGHGNGGGHGSHGSSGHGSSGHGGGPVAIDGPGD